LEKKPARARTQKEKGQNDITEGVDYFRFRESARPRQFDPRMKKSPGEGGSAAKVAGPAGKLEKRRTIHCECWEW